MLFDRPVTHIGEQLIVFNLTLIRGGKTAIVSRVPRCPGVYSWYRGFSCPTPSSATAEAFAEYLLQQATSKHCVDRRANLPPVYEVVLRSNKQFSDIKRKTLVKLCEESRFREDIAAIFRSAFLFQQPLYVGKAEELSTRIAEHLQPGSVLQGRLADVGIQIRNCWLLCVLLPEAMGSVTPIQSDREVDDVLNEYTDNEEEQELISSELVVEDLLSRLFHPLFTLRYG